MHIDMGSPVCPTGATSYSAPQLTIVDALAKHVSPEFGRVSSQDSLLLVDCQSPFVPRQKPASVGCPEVLTCISAIGTPLLTIAPNNYHGSSVESRNSYQEIEPGSCFFCLPCSVESQCISGRHLDGHKIQTGMRYETRGALRAHTASLLLSFDHHLWDRIVASLSLEDYAALAATCRWGRPSSGSYRHLHHTDHQGTHCMPTLACMFGVCTYA